MFRNGEQDSNTVQQNMQKHLFKDSLKHKLNLLSSGECTNNVHKIQEVPDIESLQRKVHDTIRKVDANPISAVFEPWNTKFHRLIELCDLYNVIKRSDVPRCYMPGKICGHIFHIKLDEVQEHTLYLTMADDWNERNDTKQKKTSLNFIRSVIYHNPIWDIGLQNQIRSMNPRKIYVNEKNRLKYTSKCICPCSIIFQKWHREENVDALHQFTPCRDQIFENERVFIEHLHQFQEDFYHRIILRVVQSNYSSIIAKIKILKNMKENRELTTTGGTNCYGKIVIPKHVYTGARYKSFVVRR